jgi:hypothetical protein
MDVDAELGRALKAVDPGPEFTARVLAAIADHRALRQTPVAPQQAVRHDVSGVPRRTGVWAWSALAASLIGAVVGAQWLEARRETARALQARTELIQALRLTSTKLNVARDVVVEHAEAKER